MKKNGAGAIKQIDPTNFLTVDLGFSQSAGGIKWSSANIALWPR
jgi:hypothetical protein